MPKRKKKRAGGRRTRPARDGAVVNLHRDLGALAQRAARETAYVTAEQLLFHIEVVIPDRCKVIVLDATAKPELLRPLFAPRPVLVLCNEPVPPAGRIIQVMDANLPRASLNQIDDKYVRLLDAIGDRHPDGEIVLIAHKSNHEGLAAASKHAGRIITAYYGALRGRNDLESKLERPIACHVVMGSPKTSEEDRIQIALAVYGPDILPPPELTEVRHVLRARVPRELGEGKDRVWDIRCMGYADARMQAVYQATVTAELAQAADRARVLNHPEAVVYIVTNEPCDLWFVEGTFADEFIAPAPKRSDFQERYTAYDAKAVELLDAGGRICNADVCRALGKEVKWGSRYWQLFTLVRKEMLEGEKKVQWKRQGN
jgi:hypothetical protein